MIDALGWPLLIGLAALGLLAVITVAVLYLVFRRPAREVRAEDLDPEAFGGE